MKSPEYLLQLFTSAQHLPIKGDVDAMHRLIAVGETTAGAHPIRAIIDAWTRYADSLEQLIYMLKADARAIAGDHYTFDPTVTPYRPYCGERSDQVRAVEAHILQTNLTLVKVHSEWLSVSKLKNIAWLLEEVTK